MSDLSSDAIKTIADLARTGEPHIIIEHGNFPFAVIPAGAKLESLEKHIFNDHAATPERIKANVTVLDPQSFIEYFNKFADGDSRIFAYEPDIMTETQREMARHALGLFALLLSSCGWNGRTATVNGRVIDGDTLLNVAANAGMSVTCVPSLEYRCCLDCKLTPAEPPRILK